MRNCSCSWYEYCFCTQVSYSITNFSKLRSLSFEIFIRYAGILSAYGMALADVVEEAQEPSATLYLEENLSHFQERLLKLQERCKEKLLQQGFQEENIVMEDYLHMR